MMKDITLRINNTMITQQYLNGYIAGFIKGNMSGNPSSQQKTKTHMQNIKFRGKRIDNGEWAYGFLVTGENIDSLIMTGNYHVNSGSDAFESFVVIPETTGQFTGLHDRFKNEIYSGDLCHAQFNYKGTIENIEGVILMDEYMWCIECRRGGEREGILSINRPYNWEVIGNIHDKHQSHEGR